MIYLQESSAYSWEWIYLLSIILSACLLLPAIITDLVSKEQIKKLPMVLSIPAWIGVFYMFGFPYNFSVWWMLLGIMSGLGAPLGALIISGLFSVACWSLCLYVFLRRAI